VWCEVREGGREGEEEKIEIYRSRFCEVHFVSDRVCVPPFDLEEKKKKGWRKKGGILERGCGGAVVRIHFFPSVLDDDDDDDDGRDRSRTERETAEINT